MEVIFWLGLFLIAYTFVGYGIVLFVLLALKRRLLKKKPQAAHTDPDAPDWPSCTVIVAAYNESAMIEAKIRNTLDLRYPRDKVSYIFVTDGSSDETPEIVRRFRQVTLLHVAERHGKIAAVHRAMQEVKTETVVFTDANTLLNADALLLLCRHYSDDRIGAVAGEKRVHVGEDADASSAGEGFYWKYESTLKRWDSELNSVVGSAGELFSIRTALYEPVAPDTILDDFMISMRIAERGYRVIYEAGAFATETSSENVGEELKRKIRIAAGGIQSVVRLRKLLNPFIDPLLTFQYVSHRVLRWTITPFLLILVFVLNAILHGKGAGSIYTALFYGQLVFYALAMVGYLLERKSLKLKIAFIPYYFCVMNYAVLAGLGRYALGKQSAVWEQARRKA